MAGLLLETSQTHGYQPLGQYDHAVLLGHGTLQLGPIILGEVRGDVLDNLARIGQLQVAGALLGAACLNGFGQLSFDGCWHLQSLRFAGKAQHSMGCPNINGLDSLADSVGHVLQYLRSLA